MKTTTNTLAAVDLRAGLGAVAAAAALVMWTATSPRFLHPIYPAAPPLFTIWMYVALAGLVTFNVSLSLPLRVALWTPLVAHLVMIAFAGYSFVRRGHWPWYSFPDPSDLHVPVLHLAALLSVAGGTLMVPIAAVVLIRAACSGPRHEWSKKRFTLLHSAAVLAVGTSLWVFEWRDRRLISWLMD